MSKSAKILKDYIYNIATLTARSQYTRKAAINQFSDFLVMRKSTLLKAKKSDLIDFFKEKVENKDKKKRMKRISFKTYLLYISYFYQFAADNDLYPQKDLKQILDYVKKFRYEKGEEKTRLSSEQLQILFEESSKHITVKIATWMILNFGFRISELLNLKVDHIDLKKNLITVHSGKGRKTRRIPILANQKPVLEQLLKVRLNYLSLDSPEPFFLINKKGKRPSVNWLQNYYVRISKEIDIHVHAHRLRRTFASILFFDYNIDIYLIAWVLGHASIQTTIKYLGINEKMKISRYTKSLEQKVLVSY